MSVLRPLIESEYGAWLAEAIPAYATDKIASGQWTQELALQLSTKEHDELLPQGLETPDNHFYAVLDEEALPVGMLWFAVTTKFNARVAYVYDVAIYEEHQRKGHATRAFQALEKELRRLGLAGIALHVFGQNVGAQALYSKLGFLPTNINLFKHIASADA